eukprot:gene4284-3100_t
MAPSRDASGSGRKRRYAPVAERGESVWKREWGSFISGVSLKTLRDGTNKVAIQSSKDLQREAEKEEEEGGGGTTFAYLFNSPAEKKAARKEKMEKTKKATEPSVSKHQLALQEAEKRGLKLDGMTRKERRKFLQLSVSAEEKAVQEGKTVEVKPHELMDDKLAWYQQGPFPIDVISEKLVKRKAEKKGKQLGLRYNYLLPHPSWLARRAAKRRESIVAPLGKRIVFDDDGAAMDPLTGQYLGAAATGSFDAAALTLPSSAVLAFDELLVDPSGAASSTVRKVVKNKEAATLIKKANLSTNFLSRSLVRGAARDGHETLHLILTFKKTNKKKRKKKKLYSSIQWEEQERYAMPSFGTDLGGSMAPHTDPALFAERIRAKTPDIFQVGKLMHKAVLSFGGAGFLVTYGLGVAAYLQQERPSLVNESFLLGAGSGVIPAVALACGPSAVKIDQIRDFIVDHRFVVTDEAKRIAIISEGISQLLPSNAMALIKDRVALTVGFSNRDPGYKLQDKKNFLFGHHISQWTDYEDVAQNLLVAMAPNTQKPMVFRGADNVLRGTMMSLSSEMDQYCRHVYIHGYVGMRFNKNQSRHNILYGRHGFLGNTRFPLWKQALCAFAPVIGGDARKADLLEAYEAGYLDALRYERWEEDPYFYAKADRSPNDDFNFRNMRASLFGGKKVGERFEL